MCIRKRSTVNCYMAERNKDKHIANVKQTINTFDGLVFFCTRMKLRKCWHESGRRGKNTRNHAHRPVCMHSHSWILSDSQHTLTLLWMVYNVQIINFVLKYLLKTNYASKHALFSPFCDLVCPLSWAYMSIRFGIRGLLSCIASLCECERMWYFQLNWKYSMFELRRKQPHEYLLAQTKPRIQN